ncbi:MAG: transcription-repair coupling factor [Clostridia bacterium]|nr:transcription-repair coupling factor [Clostridia bacterium]
MNVSSLIRQDSEFKQALVCIKEQKNAQKPLPTVINGLTDGAFTAFATELLRELTEGKAAPALLLSDTPEHAVRLSEALRSAGIRASHLPPRPFVFYSVSASHDIDRERLAVLHDLLFHKLDAVVTTATAALQYTVPPDILDARSLSLAVGDEIAPSELADRLISLGFARVDMVDGAGQFSTRGDIADVWVTNADAPVRIELFGNEIDRMGYFDPLTQRVVENCALLSLLPAREVLPSNEARTAIRRAIEAALKIAKNEVAIEDLRGELALLDGDELPFADRYLSLIYPKATLFDYLDPHALILLRESDAITEKLDAAQKLLAEDVRVLTEEGFLLAKHAAFSAKRSELDTLLKKRVTVYANTFSGGFVGMRMAGLFGFRCRRAPSYGVNFSLLLSDLKQLMQSRYRVVLCVNNQAEVTSMIAALTDEGITALSEREEPTEGRVIVTATTGIAGFELPAARVAVLSTRAEEDAGAVKKGRKRTRPRHKNAGDKILSYADLSVGDYVVHTIHGIGQFSGMEKLTVDGISRDYITIRYAGTDKLFLPADQLENISKYIGGGGEDSKVKLSRFGGTDWQKSKSRAEAAAKDMAKELIALYAERQRRAGFAYPATCDYEREFANAFEYEETEPQLDAVAEIFADMEKAVPMDRLLCGDVGFGKTEVALRAAFKAVVAGKQVAILVPTTILAMQHYQTCLSRMRGYPVNIEMLSRFRTPKERAAILRRLSRGEIDIIIGTHALLGSSVAFRDLGLLIVDEEQRFGVGQKEKLKKMSTNVDILTLTATPIPRTLNMAMNGIRDLSILDEAPGDRHPVQTFVTQHSDAVVMEAIRKELRRGGQVLYLYNRTDSMELPASRILAEIPEARVAIANGKMDKDEIERIWGELVSGDIDVLVCTTIIETGVDLPNANTLIIENADRMGLSQLHQLRGRVGRGTRQAYAYFTYKPDKTLSEISRRRLSAIKEYAEFGAGFRIALRDLEIRGAGNLLGAEQHGHIDAVGYDLYIRLLNEAVLEERGEKPKPVFESSVDLGVDAHIPERYVPALSLRMEMYKKISLIRNEEDRDDVFDELSDRFGEVPRVTERLLSIAVIRARAAALEFSRVEVKNGELRFIPAEIDLTAWSRVFLTERDLRLVSTLRTPYVARRLRSGADVLSTALDLLKKYELAKAEGENE